MAASPAAVSPEMIRGLQERAAQALPAEYVEHVEGWWLRHAPHCSWWVGTVLPHGEAGPGELLRRVVRAEEFYAARGAVARVQVTPGVCPPRLDALLAGRGYRAKSPVSLQVASSARVVDWSSTQPQQVSVDDHPTAAWFDVWHAVNGGDPQSGWDMLARLEQPCGYARAAIGDEVVAVGRVVVDDGWAGVFGMATLPQARGRGAGRSVLAALARWAESRRAGRIYLQVEYDNLPALRLYEKAGFTEVCTYHYRTAG
ncbi:putative acetyltransferase [Streptomyces sp. NBRC 110611]|uniref:GNAT family N-acetyltransferase n=1 Tax=Streptomyces sp. NBRC 110611 TaxID=1621259 RepID=UPI000858C16D|nr:GNAT family N-acetyltransferase [Streptomyces sp. NBRC 110611]GAU69735.1 putative acetyltransferase [Streptomyces sp. NBRC 110611]